MSFVVKIARSIERTKIASFLVSALVLVRAGMAPVQPPPSKRIRRSKRRLPKFAASFDFIDSLTVLNRTNDLVRRPYAACLLLLFLNSTSNQHY